MKNLKVVIVTFVCLLFLIQLNAQERFYQIENRYTSAIINCEVKSLDLGAVQQGWHSAHFVLEEVEGTNFVRIRNRWKGTYLNHELADLQMTSIEKGWWSAMWSFEEVVGTEYVRIKNRWKGTYIFSDNGRISAGTVEQGWWSAMWTFHRVNNDGQQIVKKSIKKKKSKKDPDQITLNDIRWCMTGQEKVATNVSKTIENTATDVAQGLGLTTHPHEYKVEIDACHGDIDGDHSGTNSRVTCTFYSGNKGVKGIYKNGLSSNCMSADEYYSFTTRENITHVTISIEGDDALFIDELRLYKGGNLVQHHGRDDGGGWALSTDSNDKFPVGSNSTRTQRFNY